MKKGRGDQDMNKKAWKAGAVSALAVGAGLAAAASKRKKRQEKWLSRLRITGIRNAAARRKTAREFIIRREIMRRLRARRNRRESRANRLISSEVAWLLWRRRGFLVRDAQMPGENIHILEAMEVAGGACDGIQDPTRGYVMRGGREMEDHFECLWDLFRSIPSLEVPGASVLDEYYWLNKHDPNYSLCRATVNRGEDAHTDGKFRLSQKGSMEIMKLFFTKDEDLYDKIH